jgi:CTP synthase (UTP-ammonia lyase)
MPEAAHAETDPGAPLQLIAPLGCSLVERSAEILLAEGGQFRSAYRQARITEGYHCSYGLNREHESRIFRDGLHATAHDPNGEVRGVELTGHPFFVAALFQPERRALNGDVPPLVAAFVAAMAG